MGTSAAVAAPFEWEDVDNLPIPIDLFGSKKHRGLARGELGFADSAGELVFRVVSHSKSKSSPSPTTPHRKKTLLDAAGNPVFSIGRCCSGLWQVYKMVNGEDKELICSVKRTHSTLTRTELDVLVLGESSGTLGSFKMRGFPFQKSCTIYQGDSIVAQTSLMYKLHQIYVKRGKFRLTVYPVSVDHAMLVALVVIFLAGGK